MSVNSKFYLETLSEMYADRGRDEEIDRLHRYFVESGVKHIYFQYVTVQGRVLAKAVPTDYWPKAARSGMALGYVAAGGLHVSMSGVVIGEGGSATQEGVMLPDLDTVAILPWDKEIARVFCSHYRRLEDTDGRGDPVLSDARQLLKREVRRLREEYGLVAKSGCEPEMSWFRDLNSIDASASRLPDFISPSYHVRHLEDVRPVLKKVTEYGQAMGLSMIQADYEDPGQLECNFQFDDFLKTADRLVTYRQICMQVASELGLVATFMPKPVPGIMANGCHHHVSFWDGDTNIMIDPSKSGRDNLTDRGLQAIAGLLTHAPGMMALVAPTVNSYKRFAEAIWAPAALDWGYDTRACAIRVLPGRFEYRLPDASTNPYVSHFAILAAVQHGWAQKLDAGDPQVGISTSTETQFGHLPMTLGDALTKLEGDKVIADAFGSDFMEVFLACKWDEWHRYCAAVTDWDIATYLNYAP